MLTTIEKIVPLPSRPPAAERVATQLLDLIRSGTLKSGEALPSENELASALQVSRPVVREALRGLQILGVIESRQGGRCIVTDLNVTRLLAPLQFVISLNESNLDALYQARILVETGLIRLGAAKVTKSHLERLRALVRSGYELVGDPTAFRMMDKTFHHTLMEIAGNPLMESMAQGLYELGMEYRRAASQMPGVIERSAREHDDIVSALEQGDPAKAVEAMEAHLGSIMRTTLDAMRRLDGADVAPRITA